MTKYPTKKRNRRASLHAGPDKESLIAKIPPEWLLGEPIEAVHSAFYRVFRGVRDSATAAGEIRRGIHYPIV